MKKKRRGLQYINVNFQQKNVRLHIAARTVKTICQFDWEQLPHPTRCPDLPTPDSHLFGPLKEFLRGTKFSSDDQVKNTVNNWLKTQSKDSYSEGIQKLVSLWEKCVLKSGDCIKKQNNFFLGWNVSCFITRFTLFIECPSYVYIYI